MDERQDLRAPFFAISRLRMGTDGKCITTLVTFMGCPLHCAYCINDQCHGEVYERDGITPVQVSLLLSPQELYDLVKIDNIYFQATGGGICFGGGGAHAPCKVHRRIQEDMRTEMEDYGRDGYM